MGKLEAFRRPYRLRVCVQRQWIQGWRETDMRPTRSHPFFLFDFFVSASTVMFLVDVFISMTRLMASGGCAVKLTEIFSRHLSMI